MSILGGGVLGDDGGSDGAGGAVDSVNGQTGVVSLDAADVGALATDGNGALGSLAITSASDAVVLAVRRLSAGQSSNPLEVQTESNTMVFAVGPTGNVTGVNFTSSGQTYNITSDASRFIKAGTGSPEGAVTGSVGSIWLRTDGGAGTTIYIKESGTGNTGWVANSADATLLDRDNHTGTQAISTVDGLQTALDGKVGLTGNETVAGNKNLSGVTELSGGLRYQDAAMGALVVDVTELRNTKSVSADSELTFSATPASGAMFGLQISNTDSSAHTITIPSSFSESLQTNRTSFVVPASSTVSVTWRYDGTTYRLYGDPVSINDLTEIDSVSGANDYLEIYDASAGTSKKVAAEDIGGGSSSALGVFATATVGYAVVTGSGTTVSLVGLNNTVSGTPGGVGVSSTLPASHDIVGAATTGTDTGWASANDATHFARNPKFMAVAHLQSTTNVRAWIGLTDGLSSTRAAADPVDNLAAFRFDTGASDTNWMAVTNDNASGGTITDTGVAGSTGGIFLIEVGASSTVFSINGTVVATHATNLPGSSVAVYLVSVRALADEAKTIRIASVAVTK